MDQRVTLNDDYSPRPEAEGFQSWMSAMIRYVRSGAPDLTNRQMAMIMLIYSHQAPSTVRGLAEQLKVAKPVVTRALNRLGQLGFVQRERDTSDRRNVFIRRTSKGSDFLDLFNRFIAGSGDERRTSSNGSPGTT